MRCVLQRVSSASVAVEGEMLSAIGRGFLLLVAVAPDDAVRDAQWLAKKVVGLRIFPDDEGKMNLDLPTVGGEVLVVSQFTLLGDCRKGRRPSFRGAAPPALANELYERFCEEVEVMGVLVKRGQFAADMKVQLVNDGPVTLILNSP